MATHRITESLSHRPHWLGPALLAVVVATALLSAGEARAGIDPISLIGCDNIGAVSGGGVCIPDAQQPDTFFTWLRGNDPLFLVTFDDSGSGKGIDQILLTFDATASGAFETENQNVLELSGIDTDPDRVVQIAGDVEFLGNWDVFPFGDPTVSNTGLPGNEATITWDVWGANPGNEAVARISLNFVPEPGTAALLGLGLAGLGVVGRSRRGTV